MPELLLIDDNDAVRKFLTREFAADGHAVTAFGQAEPALELLRTRGFDLIVSDIRMPGLTGLELLAALRRNGNRTPVILMTGVGTTETAIEAMRQGAFDYLIKPLDFTQLPDLLRPLVAEAIEAGRLVRGRVVLPGDAEACEAGIPLLGTSRPMQQVYKLIGQIADSDAPILIRGETGTGKEVVARAICQHSRRCDKPLVAVNCAAIPDTLLESELFGHEKGAFTGADRKRVGKFEQADGGTLLLDEIGDMNAAVQAKILRVLQEGEVLPLGASQPIRVDVRVLACTHRDLEAAIRQGKFREDLFYRLNGVTIRLPPLRERAGDLPLLVEHFLKKTAEQLGRPAPALTAEASARLASYRWPGNIRELENVVRRAVLVCRGGGITPADLELGESPEAVPTEGSADAGRARLREMARRLAEAALAGSQANLAPLLHDLIERELLIAALSAMEGNRAHVARRLGWARNTVITRIREFGLGGEGE